MSIDRLDEVYETSDYGIAFKKGTNGELREQLNEFIATIKENGEYDRLQAKWFGDKEPTEFADPNALTGTNGTIRVVACNEAMPFGYIKNGKLVGYDIDFIVAFAKEYGYTLEIEGVAFPGVLAGLGADMYDLAVAGLTITDERREALDFTDPYHKEDLIFMITGDNSDSLDQFNGASLGVVTGSLYGGYSREQFPNASIKEFNTFADVLVALKQGKVDGIMLDKPNFNSVARTDKNLSCITVPAYSVEIGFGFQKNDAGNALQAQMNEFLAELKANGKIDELIAKWYGETEPEETIPLDALASNEKTLQVAIDTTRKPFVYMYEGKPVGFEIEVLYMFCEKYGYNVQIEDLSFASGLAGLASERYDLVCGGLYMTDERKESVNFSDPYMNAEVVMAKYERSGFENFMLSLRDSFEKTFIREQRWKLIVEGICTTMIISVFSVLGGTLLGFALYMLARSKTKWLSKLAKGFAKVYSTIIAGTPTLVVLMILFYIVFTSPDMSGVVVAIIGFILTFGSFVYEQLSLTVSGVDNGQLEAAYALGYSRNQTFFRIVLPQAMKMFLPSYSGEIVSLIKATSVVGYIAVNDLTKMGDIIRGNTYEAFFPLIAVALIYFAITWGVAGLLGILKRKAEPKRRKNKNILKGVVR
jgi:polar amino acid transport system substrate-binding protein